MSAGGVAAARPAHPQAGSGASPTLALHSLQVQPIPLQVAKRLLVRHHYLHSFPGGTQLAFGVFRSSRLMGAVALGVGPFNAHSLVESATIRDCLTLSRLWLADELPPNSESRVLGVVIRALKRHTTLKFLITYADPIQGHVGTIYQATGWVYTGLSETMPLYDAGDGRARHSRSLSHAFGTHSLKHFQRLGVPIKRLGQPAKHRYVFFLDSAWRSGLRVPALPYPKLEMENTELREPKCI